MLVLPVLDILDGHVVHGKAGRRTEYRPIESGLTASSKPADLAQAIRDTFGLTSFYLADLDAIIRHSPDFQLYERLISDGFDLLVDAGVRDRFDAAKIRETGVSRIIVALETCRSPDDLAVVASEKANVVFGLDLLNGSPMKRIDAVGWADDPQAIISQAMQSSVNAILPLDLSDVGMSTGGSTDSLCRFVREKFPAVRLITGGGVRSRADLERLSKLGVDEVLVASALHDGRLTPKDVLV